MYVMAVSVFPDSDPIANWFEKCVQPTAAEMYGSTFHLHY